MTISIVLIGILLYAAATAYFVWWKKHHQKMLKGPAKDVLMRNMYFVILCTYILIAILLYIIATLY